MKTNLSPYLAVLVVHCLLVAGNSESAEGREWLKRGTRVERLYFLPTSSYFKRTRQAIESARRSIHVVMYAIGASQRGESEVNQLLGSLLEAHRRGVEVKVLLDYNLEKMLQEWNEIASRRLKIGGIDVRFDHPKHVTHTKLVVVDGYVSILGSANWSGTAFQYNWESSVLIESAEVGRRFAEYANRVFEKGRPLEEWQAR